MALPRNLSNIDENFGGGGTFPHLPSGIYKCIIHEAFDNEHPSNGKQARMEFQLDIAEGEYKGFFEDTLMRVGFWTLTDFENYGSEKTLPYFKGFIKRVMDSNSGWKYDAEPNHFVGCIVYASIQAEERQNKNNPQYTNWRYSVENIYSVKEFKKGADYNNVPLNKPKDKPLANKIEEAPKNDSLDTLKDDIQF